ncbi:MAG: tRNA pseudouridine(55) synthase TruB, partial [Lachnospiraceae bacterium]|nr:tRNA pseudouridine(55) synthase TruB [Lachnospiraceae bacterium]
MYNGVINIYKEKGFTSHDVVAKMRGILQQKKIGHTGTLDPEAVGVLPVCLGNATRLADMLTDRDKEYEAVMRLGVTTDTQDMSGTVLEEKPVLASAAEVEAAMESFVGGYEQVPPMYSALKINGKRLYELAREGREVERKPRRVSLYGIEILSMQLPEVSFRVSCSKGTYIRTLCHDIGGSLGCGAAMSSLKRTKSGCFTLDTAITLSRLEQLRDEKAIEKVLVPVDAMFDGLAAVHVPDIYIRAVQN